MFAFHYKYRLLCKFVTEEADVANYFSAEIINIIGLLNSSPIAGKFSSISVLGSGSTQAFILNPLCRMLLR